MYVIEQNYYSYISPLYTGHSISIRAQNGYIITVYNDITTRLLIIYCNSIMLTITTALCAGSVDHVI